MSSLPHHTLPAISLQHQHPDQERHHQRQQQLQHHRQQQHHPPAYPGLPPIVSPPHDAPIEVSELSPSLGSPLGGDSAATASDTADASRPKQKRNKPTLSCEECVERKTKCDRGRPTCLSCVRRQTDCHYTHVANLIASAKTADGAKARYITKPSIKARRPNAATTTAATTTPVSAGFPQSVQAESSAATDALGRPAESLKRKTTHANPDSPYLASALPFSKSTPSNVFGVGSQHPFSNYWTAAAGHKSRVRSDHLLTCLQGGIAEVVSVLPSKEQADILVAKYFQVVDGVYPIIHRGTFYLNYENFWASPTSVRVTAEADFIAMHCAMYALGTQFMQFPSYRERTQSAEFYASAANQALRIYSYLNRASLRSVAAMILLTYFLMNDNHASDAYAWSGILLRQAYAMRLHRDPDLIRLDVSQTERQTRRKLWQAVFFQDTFLTVLLKLPPTATHSDVQVDSLLDETSFQADGFSTGFNSRVENLMSISVIAPPEDAPAASHVDTSRLGVDPLVDQADVRFIQSMWKLGNLVQENISSPLSLSLPLVSSPRQKTSLISSFRSLYRSFPASLTTLDSAYLAGEAQSNPRVVRQNLFLTSNYYHCLMILQASENVEAGVECNVRGSLEAAHEAIWAYFKLARFFEIEATIWWVFQHRAFEEALTIARLLSVPPTGESSINDSLYAKCKGDVMNMIELVRNNTAGNVEMQNSRLASLEAAYARIGSN